GDNQRQSLGARCLAIHSGSGRPARQATRRQQSYLDPAASACFIVRRLVSADKMVGRLFRNETASASGLVALAERDAVIARRGRDADAIVGPLAWDLGANDIHAAPAQQFAIAPRQFLIGRLRAFAVGCEAICIDHSLSA